jgi:hypothetical protein
VEKATPNRQVQAIRPLGVHAVHIGAPMNKFNDNAIRRCADRNKLWTVCGETPEQELKSLSLMAFQVMPGPLVQSGDMWEKHTANVDAKV